jgi:hypothetical protein
VGSGLTVDSSAATLAICVFVTERVEQVGSPGFGNEVSIKFGSKRPICIPLKHSGKLLDLFQ